MKPPASLFALSAILPWVVGASSPALPLGDVPVWLPVVLSAVGPACAWLSGALLRAAAAYLHARSAARHALAQRLLNDKDPANDTEAAKLEAEAVAVEAGAKALESAANHADNR